MLSDWWEVGTDYHEHRSDCDYGVEAVNYAAVTGEKLSVVLNAILSFNQRAGEVADLCNHGENETGEGKAQIICLGSTEEGNTEISVKHEAKGTAHATCDSALNALFGADDRGELMLAEE